MPPPRPGGRATNGAYTQVSCELPWKRQPPLGVRDTGPGGIGTSNAAAADGDGIRDRPDGYLRAAGYIRAISSWNPARNPAFQSGLAFGFVGIRSIRFAAFIPARRNAPFMLTSRTC